MTDTAEALDERLSVAVGEWGRVGRPRRDGVDGARIIVSWCRLQLHSEVAGIIGAFLDEAGELRHLTQRRRGRCERTGDRQKVKQSPRR